MAVFQRDSYIARESAPVSAQVRLDIALAHDVICAVLGCRLLFVRGKVIKSFAIFVAVKINEKLHFRCMIN